MDEHVAEITDVEGLALMGTSSNHPGSGSGTPLVPPWADPGATTPSPPADPQRFREFRTALGRFAASGSSDALRSALKHFASKSLGGSTTGGRRFTAMVGAGADAMLAFGGQGGIAGALTRAGVDLAALRGASINTVVEAIARAFAPNNGDHDKVEAALRSALLVVLEEVPDFDVESFGGFTEQQYVDLIAVYLENCVLEHILAEGGEHWDRAATSAEQVTREAELRALIQTAIGQHMQPLVDGGIMNMNRDGLVAAERAVIEGVLRSWEEFGD